MPDAPLENLSDDQVQEVLPRLVKTYILADKMGDCTSANSIVEGLIDVMIGPYNVPNAEFVLHVRKTPRRGRPFANW